MIATIATTATIRSPPPREDEGEEFVALLAAEKDVEPVSWTSGGNGDDFAALVRWLAAGDDGGGNENDDSLRDLFLFEAESPPVREERRRRLRVGFSDAIESLPGRVVDSRDELRAAWYCGAALDGFRSDLREAFTASGHEDYDDDVGAWSSRRRRRCKRHASRVVAIHRQGRASPDWLASAAAARSDRCRRDAAARGVAREADADSADDGTSDGRKASGKRAAAGAAGSPARASTRRRLR